jgi:dihydroxyacetone kinase-like protein
MAREMSERPIATVITDDDVAVEKSTFSTGRRGVAGTLIVEKILGAAAEEGRNLAALKMLGDRVNAATRSIGIALTSCTVPAAGKPTFDIAEDEMEIGVGIHGEPGRRRVKLRPAAEIAAEMVNAITADLGERARGEAILLINGFGATPLSELYLMYDAVRRLLEAAGGVVTRSLVGNFVTSLDMAGCSATVSMLDAETKRLWDAPVHTPALRWGM